MNDQFQSRDGSRSRDGFPSAEASALLITESSRDKIMFVSDTVTARKGGYEFSLLVFGPPGRDLVTDVSVIQGQEVGVGSFDVDAEALQRSIAQSLRDGTEIKGIAHRHPGTGSWSVYHSETDIRHIEGELMPMLAAISLKERRWGRLIEPEVGAGGRVRYSLDSDGRQSLSLRLPAFARAGARTEAPPARLEVVERGARIFSLVFNREAWFYCCSLLFRFPPVACEDGAPRVVESIVRQEPGVEVVPDESVCCPAARIDPGEIERQVRDGILVRYGSYSSRGWSSYGSAGTGSLAAAAGADHGADLAEYDLDETWKGKVS
jgi:hypothetical protein